MCMNFFVFLLNWTKAEEAIWVEFLHYIYMQRVACRPLENKNKQSNKNTHQISPPSNGYCLQAFDLTIMVHWGD